MFLLWDIVIVCAHLISCPSHFGVSVCNFVYPSCTWWIMPKGLNNSALTCCLSLTNSVNISPEFELNEIWKKRRKEMSALHLLAQKGSRCLTTQQRDKQARFYWENLLSGMVLCTDIKDNHIYQHTAKHPQVSLAENKACIVSRS